VARRGLLAAQRVAREWVPCARRRSANGVRFGVLKETERAFFGTEKGVLTNAGSARQTTAWPRSACITTLLTHDSSSLARFALAVLRTCSLQRLSKLAFVDIMSFNNLTERQVGAAVWRTAAPSVL
jgi:hypothetical protein